MASRWDQRKNRAIGTKEDVRIINNFLDQQIRKIENLAESIQNKGIPISAQNLMDYYKGKSLNSTQILAEFQKNNDGIVCTYSFRRSCSRNI